MDGSTRGEFIPEIRLIIGGGERKYALVSVLRMEPCTYTRAGGVHVYNSPRKHVTLGTRNDTVYTNGSMGGTCYIEPTMTCTDFMCVNPIMNPI